jgi:uncharacterized protein (DUF433 family)/DNA-binding transcriptional MerR regulator
MGAVREMPPRGHYLAHEVGWLAGVSGDRIGQWARRGYIQSSQSTGRPRVYSYQDVAEAMVVHELVDNGADLKSIKRSVQRLRDRLGMSWPLQHARAQLGTVYGNVVEFAGDIAYDLGGKGSEWQHVFEPDNLRKIAGELERGGWAVRLLPDLRYIEVNPDRLSGRPVIRGRRVPADEVAQIAETPEGLEVLHEDYELRDEEIRDAQRWWHVASAYEPQAA